jgi:hypothetical protein
MRVKDAMSSGSSMRAWWTSSMSRSTSQARVPPVAGGSEPSCNSTSRRWGGASQEQSCDSGICAGGDIGHARSAHATPRGHGRDEDAEHADDYDLVLSTEHLTVTQATDAVICLAQTWR